MSNLSDCLGRIKKIAELLDDDDPEKVEMMNIDGDYTSLMNWALRKRAENIAYANAAKDLKERYEKRKKSFDNKADSMKNIVEMLMDAANEESFKSEVGTASFRKVAPKPIITDEDKIPDEWFKKSIDKTKINKAIKDGQSIEGVSMDNGGRSLTIR